jgi:hypothetical protein
MLVMLVLIFLLVFFLFHQTRQVWDGEPEIMIRYILSPI